MPVATIRCATAAALAVAACDALDNGFTKPALGWSSWYAAPMGSQVTDAFVRASAKALISSGLAKKGYKYVNVDEGWLKGRHAGNNTIYEDLDKFPSGMKSLGDWVTAQPTSAGSNEKLVYGLYSCRGTCQCGTRAYHGPGSNGHEAADTQWMIDAGARWLKIDSCCGSQNHSVAFSDYSKFRDAMNASGQKVWFNLCGWNEWYAPPDPALHYAGGQSIGNSYRISGDGGSWGAITKALNVMASVTKFTHPGGYPDPDNILGPHGTVGRVSESQARVQMVLWSMAPTQLILGEDVTKMSAEFIETVGNEELIAVNQDFPLVAAAKRIVGGDLHFPCGVPAPIPGATATVTAEVCIAAGADARLTQTFYFNTTDGSLRLGSQPSNMVATESCDFSKDGNIVSLFAEGAGGTKCGGSKWGHNSTTSQIIGAASKCLDEFEFTTPRVDLWGCDGGSNEKWAFSVDAATVGGFATGTLKNARSGKCLTASVAGPTSNAVCENIWSRPLANGDLALAMVNQGAGNATMICDSTCFAAAGLGKASKIRVRDMIAHADLPELSPPFSFETLVPGEGSAAAFRLTPMK